MKSPYIKILSKNHPNAKGGYVLEHRLVVEAYIGRYLTRSEVIHHIDENKTNNSIENLMLFQNQKAHASFHTKIRQFGMTRPVLRQINKRWENYPSEIDIIPVRTTQDINTIELL